MSAKNGREALNLSINGQIKRLMKSQCAAEGKEVSEVTEGLYLDFLAKRKIAPSVLAAIRSYPQKEDCPVSADRSESRP